MADRETNKLMTKKAVDPQSVEDSRGRNNSNERDGEQGSGSSASALLPLPDQYRCGQVMRKMNLPLTGLIKAMVWFCGIDGVKEGSHDEWRMEAFR